MANPPLLQITSMSLTHGGNPILDDVTLQVMERDRLALIGRNGSGKSTLLKLIEGTLEADSGTRTLGTGVRVGRLAQTPATAGFETLHDFASAGLDEAGLWRIESCAEGLRVDLSLACATASGGEQRKASLARLLAEEPEILLLDEPTNHLDIQAILWLESWIGSTASAIITVSHDRAFLKKVTRAMLWLDRGELRRKDATYASFESWREETYEAEDLARHKLDRKIKAEARWAVEGISARRKRNQGRVRALADLRDGRDQQIRRASVAQLDFAEASASGRLVLDAKGISKSFGGDTILAPFDLRLLRGDRLAVIGANGAGKTTLLRMLIGELAPDTGEIRLGSRLEVQRLEQNRLDVAPDVTLWDALTNDPELGLPGSSDQVMVQGSPRHVAGYLKDFLFHESQLRAPVHSLSGGEKARLALARIMARPSNLLILDEPTNDLDIETLDLLEEQIADYPGTVILVSHDRDFIDQIASVSLVLRRGKRPELYPGGFSGAMFAPVAEEKTARADVAQPKVAAAGKGNTLSFTERHRLGELPGKIDQIEREIARLAEALGAPDLFSRDPAKGQKISAALSSRQGELEVLMAEWLDLEARGGA